MKHSTDFPVDRDAPSVSGASLGYLPIAPLPMPKQILERKAGPLAFLRALVLGTFARQ